MLGDFGDEMDQTSSRMDSVLKKLEKVSHMTSSKCFVCVVLQQNLKIKCEMCEGLSNFNVSLKDKISIILFISSLILHLTNNLKYLHSAQ